MKKKDIILFSCMNVILLFFFYFVSLNMMKMEFYYFAGNEKVDVDIVQQYMQSDPSIDSIEKGKEKVAASGYAITAETHMTRKISKYLIPCFCGGALLSCVGCVILLKKNQSDEKEMDHLQRQNTILLNENGELLNKSEANKKEMMQYEEHLYHQLKTPLTGLKLSLETIRETEENKNALNVSKEQIDKMSNLITLFLKDRKMSANQIRFHFENQNMIYLIKQAIKECIPLANKMQKKILFSVKEDCVFMKCDDVWMKECLLTLIENSLSHGNDDVEIMCENGNAFFNVQVITKNILVDEAILPHLFERFYTDDNQHFGIGLHMAKLIVEQHHGTLSVYNDFDYSQVVFEIHLPILSGKEAYDVSGL